MMRKPLFFVIAGAHGVGKTTAVGAATVLLESRGAAVRRFHHIVDTAPLKASGRMATTPPSRLRSWWRRAVPHPLKMLVTSTLNELRYWSRINGILAEAAITGQIAIADRYAYDRLVDIRIRRRPLIQRAVLRVVCSLMRRPTLTILLTDKATAVYQRKQELSVAEINRYQDDLEVLCNRLGAPLTTIRVAGRNADDIAQVVAGIIIESTRQNDHPTSMEIHGKQMQVTDD